MQCNNRGAGVTPGGADCPIDVDGMADDAVTIDRPKTEARPVSAAVVVVVKRDPSSSDGGLAMKRDPGVRAAALQSGEDGEPGAAVKNSAAVGDSSSAVAGEPAKKEDSSSAAGGAMKKSEEPSDPSSSMKTSAENNAATESEGEDGAKKPDHPPLARPRWTFYATLLSTANITAESVGRLPRLVEFIHHRRREDDASILYARFDRRSRLTEEWFLEQTGALGIRVDPGSIPGTQSQPQEYQATKGRVARDARVDFHWIDGAVVDHPAGKKKSKAMVKPQSPSSGGEDDAAVLIPKKRKVVDPPPTDYKDMTIGQIMQVIERQKAVITSQRESIRRMTEGGGGGGADNVAYLQADNADLETANRKLKVELREVKRANEDLREEIRALKKS